MKAKFILAIPHTFKISLFTAFLLCSTVIFGQGNSLVEIEDLSLRFIFISNTDEINIVTDFSKHRTIGLFLDSHEKFDLIRICNGSPFNVWLNSRLFFTNQLCMELTKSDLFRLTNSDSVYLAFNTDGNFKSVNASIMDNDFDRTIITNPIGIRDRNVPNSLFIVINLLLILLLGGIKYYIPSLYRDLFRISVFRISTFIDKGNEFDLSIVALSLLLSFLSGFCFWYINDFSNLNYLSNFSRDLLQWFGYSSPGSLNLSSSNFWT